MAHLIAVSNQKGGVGKTTTTVNLAACLGALGHRCLLIDMDPQANASSACGLDVNNLETSVYDTLLDAQPALPYSLHENFANLSVLPSSIDLAGAEIELMDRPDRETVLKRALEPLHDQFDYILIDCPPSLGILTMNALIAAQRVLIPVQAEYLALEGLSRMVLMIQRIQKRFNPPLELLGIVATMYDGRTNLSQQVLAELHRAFPGKVFDAAITRSVRLSEAPSYGKPILYYDPRSNGSDQYLKLAQEIVHVCEEEARAGTGA